MNLAILLAALCATAAIAGMAVTAGFVAAMPDGTLARGVTPRLRLELYVLGASALLLEGHVWLSLAHR